MEGIPRPRPESFERQRLQFRPGIVYAFNSSIEFEARGALHLNSEKNDDFPLGDGSSLVDGSASILRAGTNGSFRRVATNDHLTYSGRQDNFRPNSIALDRLNIRYKGGDRLELVAGRFENPFDTTEATWDSDLQPQGAAGSFAWGGGIRSKITAAAFVNTQLYNDESRMAGGQYTLSGGETWPLSFDVSLGYFVYDDLEVLGRRNWRNNRTVGTGAARRFASDFEIADVILRLRSDRWFPIEIYYDAMRNLGASNDGERDGMETGFRVGRIGGLGSFRFAYTYQDLDRDAVMTAFNGDDWYLHSWYRGHLVRAGVGLGRGFAVQGTYVKATHHETAFDTTRWMIDLVKR